jgi:hypothetical protein
VAKRNKLVKATYICKVVIRSDDKNKDKVPDFGLGKGVLGTAEVTWTDSTGHGFNRPMFVAALKNKESELIEECVEVVWEKKE